MPVFNTMEFIWNSLEKLEDGRVRYTPHDALFLWDYGFVDTDCYSKEEWLRVLNPFKQPDGNYILSYKEFETLDTCRYKGKIKIPFDALKINEGKYTDEGFQELVDHAIAVSCHMPDWDKKVEQLKKDFRQSDGLILIKGPAKVRIKEWIEKYPSPTRRREQMFEDFLRQNDLLEESVAGIQKTATVATAEQQAAVQASTFSMLPTNLVAQKAGAFKTMTQAKGKQGPAADKTTELKRVKRSKKGMRG